MIISKPNISRRDLIVLAGVAAGSRFVPAFAGAKTTATRSAAASSTLFYKPERTGNIWDTWIYHHQGKYYLYYNPSPAELKTMGGWNCIALATSSDGVHWQEHGKVLDAARGAAWLGAGSVWTARDAKGEKFIMNFSEWIGPDSSGAQSIFFAESRDLIHWQRLGPESEFRHDTRWYEPRGRWDNIWPVPRPEGGYYGYWAAAPKNDKVGLGFGESLDGIAWRALEPALAPEVPLGSTILPSPEVAAVHLWRNRYYALAGLNDTQPTTDAQLSFFRPGETTLVADSPAGPFLLARKNRRFLVGNASYFARFVDTPGGVLVNHHSWEIDPGKILGVDPDRVYMAPLKKAQWDDEGTLRLMWWQGNEIAKSKRVQLKAQLSQTAFDPARTLILEGVMPLSSSPTGLYLQGTNGRGTGFLVHENGLVEYGDVSGDSSRFEKKGYVDRELALADTARFRLIRKGRITELYLNDYLMQCYSLPELGTGRISELGPAGSFSGLNAWYCA